jgi:hypothetical protein
MSLLASEIQKQIWDGFRGKLLKGFIRQKSIDVSAGLDELGDPIDTGHVDTKCEGFASNYSDRFKATGITELDMKVCIFGGSIPGIQPGKDDIVMLKGITGDEWYQLRGPVKKDPATALWTCQAVPTGAQ